jgi:hypothetical protein
MVTDQQVAALVERTQDDEFAARLYDDPLDALRSDGYEEFAGDVERQLAQIDALVGQLVDDGTFRARVEEDPAATLAEWGLPGPAIMPVLGILGAPEDVLDRAADQIELHGKRTRVTAAAAAAVLGALAFAQSATAASPDGFRMGSIDAQAQVQPSGIKWGSADPSGIRWSSADPSGIKWGSDDPSGIRWSSAGPNPIKWGAAPEAVRYGGLQSFFRSR